MEENNIIIALETIHNTSKKSKLKLASYDSIQVEIKLVSDYFQVNTTEVILLATCFIQSCFDSFELPAIIKHFGLEKHSFLKYLGSFNLLISKSILTKTENRHSENDYRLSNHIYDYILNQKTIPKELLEIKIKENTFTEFLSDMDILSNQKDDEKINYYYFIQKFKDLLNTNKHFKLIEFALKNLELVDTFVFFDTILDAMNCGENDFNTGLQSTVEDFYERKRDSFKYINNFLEEKTKLNQFNLIEKDSNSFSNRHRIQLTVKAVLMLKEWEGISLEFVEKKDKRLIYPDQIQKRNLFYNREEELQLDPIKKSLSNTSFIKLQTRLKSKNMNAGIATILYGAPGTGKTESVYQLAKKYNRSIFKVEISETKSMWFGESQKLVKKIFTDYYNFKKTQKVCPILLFNEADAIIGKRKSAGSSSVADTENAIQNVLLEELENFDGILFATSNLVANLDSAFERRFLFKVKFENPSIENAAKIWKSKLPTLSSNEAILLASQFSYSGGEMENIARKAIMDEIVFGNKPNFERIRSFCENEKWSSKNSGIRIGY
ncbi:ATP-binding protein [Flavobacterium nackdongense]|uniref:AAA family ATPase n=1 Tax=Flavobacterium nackdongense TaxID=2547394 RepID=A0A4P6Y9K0_9FLAO|nr:ATP-binding protein [Flavobacterium nackdongense]QBN17255.1 AAA family ATPase [Flavobacterium nackdongense]